MLSDNRRAAARAMHTRSTDIPAILEVQWPSRAREAYRHPSIDSALSAACVLAGQGIGSVVTADCAAVACFGDAS